MRIGPGPDGPWLPFQRAGDGGSRWSAQSAARTNDLEAVGSASYVVLVPFGNRASDFVYSGSMVLSIPLVHDGRSARTLDFAIDNDGAVEFQKVFRCSMQSEGVCS